ncbi:hypothetical protein [Caballeronia grimmiae]|uniref:hypothetical protein n=1 Tax=Caballeronia grimmiae TaxID=1071679 RepID=UPI000ADCB3C8|nr:hypothetical protein [Caballeronia grimmiae]
MTAKTLKEMSGPQAGCAETMHRKRREPEKIAVENAQRAAGAWRFDFFDNGLG